MYKEEMANLAIVKIDGIKEEGKIGKRVRQGGTFSPTISKDIQESINITREETNLGINMNGKAIGLLRFADDIAIIVDNEKYL